MGLESLGGIAKARQEVVLDILMRAEINRESARKIALEEIEKTTASVDVIHQAYIKGVEDALGFIQSELKKVIEVQSEPIELEEIIKNRFDTIGDITEVSTEQAFDFGYKNATSAIRDLETAK